MIIPLGSEYLELIAVVDDDEAQVSPRSRRVLQAVAAGETFVTWAVRTEDLDATREHLLASGLRLPPVEAGSRRRPDGSMLQWRTQALEPGSAAGVLPFCIEWNTPPAAHPGRMPVTQPARADGIASVTIGHPEPETTESRLHDLLGDAVPLTVERASQPGLVAVEVRVPDGKLTIR